jgi:lipoate-protein ligase B
LRWEVILKQNIPWEDLERLQEDLIRRAKQEPNLAFLLFSEPHSTFTSGRSADPSELVWSESERENKKVRVEKVSRGGKWTYHGPGQVVCYPIVNLDAAGFHKKKVRYFTETLRNAVLQSCLDWGIPAEAKDNPFGIFVGIKKLASFGLSFQQGISSHGVALYLKSQSDFFSGIRACGMTHQSFTCLHDFLPELSWNNAALALANSIEKGFKTV